MVNMKVLLYICAVLAIQCFSGANASGSGTRKRIRRHTRRSDLETVSADNDFQAKAILTIDGGRRRLDNVNTNGKSNLPKSCLTYEERYEPYRISSRYEMSLGEGNEKHLDSKYVVILQMHKATDELKEDLVLSIRALAREVQSVGFHFYILFQNPKNEAGDETGQHWSRERVLSLLPRDMRDVMIIHDAKEEYELYYPKIGLNSKADTDWGPGSRAPHAGMSIFMHRYQSYDFAYAVEYDVRLTGHWGHFLAAAIHLGTKAEGTEAEGLEGIEMEGEREARLPSHTPKGLPALIAFEGVWESTTWVKSQVGFNYTVLPEMKAMIYGGSRRLFDKMHEVASEGRNIYLESLLPALVDMLPHGKRIAIKIAMEGDSYHCNSRDASLLYERFLTTATGQCTETYLIHPVKNQESWWNTAEHHKSSFTPDD